MSLRDSLTVMVVDDLSTSRALITMALEEMGIKHIDYRKDGASALSALAVKPCHLVISDYNMPGMDGLQLLKALRMNRSTQKIGFILVSGRLDQQIVATGKALAINNFIRKPFSTDQMRACIQAVVGAI